MDVVNSIHLDANETVFFQRQLEFIKSRTFDIKYPEFKAILNIPVSTEAGEGATSITYMQFDGNGVSKFIADYSDDLSNIEVQGKEFTSRIREIGNSYQFSTKEIRAAAFANKSLRSMKAERSRRANDQLVDDIGWFADGTPKFAGLVGLIYNPNINVDPAPNGGWGAATPDAIIADVNFAIDNPLDVTNGVEIVNTCLLSVPKFRQISTTPRSTTSDTTILQFLQQNHPLVRFDHVAKLKALDPKPSGGAGPVEIILAYRNDPNNLTFEIPMPYKQHPPQERNLAQVINTESSNGGVIIYYPLSVQIVEGI